MFGETSSQLWLMLHRIEDRVESRVTWAERQLSQTIYSYKSRVERLRSALADSRSIAWQAIVLKLEGIDLSMIWEILYSALHDIALYYGGSVVLGTAIGAGAGAFAGGVGAVPGAAIGMAAGAELGGWVLTFLGLAMVAKGLTDTIPQAMVCYKDGFRAAWEPTTQEGSGARAAVNPAASEKLAAHRFADGHVLMVVGMLIALMFYLTKGGNEEALLLKAVRGSKRLGPKVADWLVKNKEALMKHPALRPRMFKRELPEESPSPGPTSKAGRRPIGKGAVPKADDAAASGATKNFKLDSDTINRIKAIPKGERPDPSTYMPKEVIDDQLSQFDDGASRFMLKKNLDKYGPAQTDGTSFLMTRQQADDLLQSTGGDPAAMEDALGLPSGSLSSNQLVRVDVPNPRQFNLRIPSGNEAGANDQWIPGGKLPTGNLEAVLDLGGVPASSYNETPIQF
ncbi:DUF6861 domain-containing protein [Dyella flagellata]|uniref:NAD(+)--protein-arginine ADP-ribosyltransferase Tre1-like N-terminal domain-containing protein n=1 Tax=Dyella flagellata TaxID=1867833 RepID=A0ABQ5X6F1_9GAMM|nr:hypothetical protein [Dyella flagellata]GLQ87153.1 hypothetical protein GCM10007898_07190 [Dyella flagellata]